MLRRAPTSISLSMRDVEEHLEHIKQEKAKDHENSPPRRRQPSSLSSLGFTEFRPERYYHHEHSKTGPRVSPGPYDISSLASLTIVSPDQLPTVIEGDEAKTELYANCEEEDGFIPINSPASSESVKEPPKLRAEECFEPNCVGPSQDFNHAGFEETNADACPSLASQDVCTPHRIELKDFQRLRARTPLPGSPLVVSHGVESPERRSTSSLTPRVASYGTPSVLLSQPARRLISYRPRTLSYSFEESDRASAAYEEVQGSDNDSDDSGPVHAEQKSLQEELEESSSLSVSIDSNLASSPPSAVVDKKTVSIGSSQAEQVSEENRVFYFSSPQLPLPPPFSAVRRNISSAGALPSSSRSPSATPPRSGVRGLRASPTTGPLNGESGEHSSPEFGSALRNLAALPFRLLELYRSRSPLQYRKESTGQESISPTPRTRSEGQNRSSPGPSSPRPQFQIYNDRLPASIQPQTPEHLPESRHQSRLHPSYTAPIDPRTDSVRLRRFTNDRRRGTRSDSPPGMDTPGFSGLYGGQENTDDEVMFERAAQRLFAASSARQRRAGSMHSTAEREEWLGSEGGEHRRI